MGKAGRPKININWDRVEELLEAGAGAEGIAALIGCDRDTLYKRCKKDKKCEFSTLRQLKRAKGDEMIREAQFKAAITGDKTMMIWLGKNRLNQVDKSEHTGPGGGPIQIRVVEPFVEQYDDDVDAIDGEILELGDGQVIDGVAIEPGAEGS